MVISHNLLSCIAGDHAELPWCVCNLAVFFPQSCKLSVAHALHDNVITNVDVINAERLPAFLVTDCWVHLWLQRRISFILNLKTKTLTYKRLASNLLTFKKNLHVVSLQQICQNVMHKMARWSQSQVYPSSKTIDSGS